MKASHSRMIRLDIASRFDLLDIVQTVLSHLSGMIGFDEEAIHFMSVAVRESVVNAIKHGNRMDEQRRVVLAFTMHPREIEVEVRDEGKGFDPDSIPDPVAEENLLKTYGRGIFFMRSFMDTLHYSFPPEGGTVVRMTKRVAAAESVTEG